MHTIYIQSYMFTLSHTYTTTIHIHYICYKYILLLFKIISVYITKQLRQLTTLNTGHNSGTEAAGRGVYRGRERGGVGYEVSIRNI